MASIVMRQRKQYELPPQIKSATKKEITTAERIHFLDQQGKGAIINTKEKRLFFHRTLELKGEVMDHAHAIDQCSNHTNLVCSLRLILPLNVKMVEKDWKREELASRFLQLHEPFKFMILHIREQQKIAAASARGARTRSVTKEIEEEPVLKLLDEVVNVVRKVDQEVIYSRTKELYEKYSKVSLTHTQRSRRWSASRVPAHPNEQYCVMCGHKSTNYPMENDEIEAVNHELLKKHEAQQKAWDKYRAEKAKGSDPRKPPRPGKTHYKQPIIQCMCAMSFCTSSRPEGASFCPISCSKSIATSRDDNNNNTSSTSTADNQQDRYPYTGMPLATCSCPICCCTCSFACTADDLPELLFATTLAGTENIPSFEENSSGATAAGTTNQSTSNSQQQQQFTSSLTDTSIFKNSVGEGVQLGLSWLKDEMLSSKLPAATSSSSISSSSNNFKNFHQRAESLICEHAAMNISSRTNKISLLQRQLLQKQAGPPDTTVILPCGRMDTRALMQSGQHAKNNGLGASNKGGVPQGMVDKQRIDFRMTSDEYRRQYNAMLKFEQERQAAANRDVTETAGSDDVVLELSSGSENEEEKDTNGQEMNDVVDAGGVMGDVGSIKKKNKIGYDVDGAVADMHNRVLSRLRKQMTDEVEVSLEVGKSPEIRKKIKRIKTNLEFLETAEAEGSHLNKIKCVTSNGAKLFGSEALCSQEVIERVEMINDDISDDEN